MKRIIHIIISYIDTFLRDVLLLNAKAATSTSSASSAYICASEYQLRQGLLSPYERSALFDYTHPHAKRSMWAFKFRNSKTAIELFGDYIADEIIDTLFNTIYMYAPTYKATLVAIPSSAQLRGERHWDQMHELTTYICMRQDIAASCTYIPHVFTLSATQSQHAATKKERFQVHKRLQLSSRFMNSTQKQQLRAGIFHTIFILDDITTTGSTLHRAQQLIKEITHSRTIVITQAVSTS